MPPNDDRLDEILHEARAARKQAEATNGRVTALEHTVNGNPYVRLPSGHRDRGLVGRVHDNSEVVDAVRRAVQVGKWVAATFSAAAVGLAANLAQLL